MQAAGSFIDNKTIKVSSSFLESSMRSNRTLLIFMATKSFLNSNLKSLCNLLKLAWGVETTMLTRNIESCSEILSCKSSNMNRAFLGFDDLFSGLFEVNFDSFYNFDIFLNTHIFYRNKFKFRFKFASLTFHFLQFFPIDNPTFTTNDNFLMFHSSLSRIYNLFIPFQEFQQPLKSIKLFYGQLFALSF